MSITTGRKLTANDLLDMGSEGERYELDDGELIERAAAGPDHGETVNEVAFLLTHFVKKHGLGRIWTGDVGFQLLEDRVRAPDVAFVSRERLLRTPKPKKGFYPGPPDLVIEVHSPRDETGQLLLKVSRFLTAGTPLVWVVDPQRQSVTVYRASGEVLALGSDDELSGEDVLPGFSCRVSELFLPPLEA